MAHPSNLLVLVIASSFLAASTMISARKLNSKTTLLTRPNLDEEGSTSCWDSLLELQSCSGEVVLFFLNGETQLGPNCCNAIRVIEHQCWPSLLGSIGITTEESDILRGFCDATASAGGVSVSNPPTSPTNAANSHITHLVP